MIRKTLDPDSPYIDAAVHGDGLTSLQFRRTAGAETEQLESAVKGADVIQLERRGATYIMSVARFGERRAAASRTGDPAALNGYATCVAIHHVVPPASFTPPRLSASSFFFGSWTDIAPACSARW